LVVAPVNPKGLEHIDQRHNVLQGIRRCLNVDSQRCSRCATDAMRMRQARRDGATGWLGAICAALGRISLRLGRQADRGTREGTLDARNPLIRRYFFWYFGLRVSRRTAYRAGQCRIPGLRQWLRDPKLSHPRPTPALPIAPPQGRIGVRNSENRENNGEFSQLFREFRKAIPI